MIASKPKEVPYYTSDDESQWCGHVWRQRDRIGGRWGFAWEVIPPYGVEGVACGWCGTQQDAEARMNEKLTEKKGPTT